MRLFEAAFDLGAGCHRLGTQSWCLRPRRPWAQCRWTGPRWTTPLRVARPAHACHRQWATVPPAPA